jgi:hypothetical protein
MISFERSFDYELIRSCITHPRIYKYLSDDYSPLASEYRPQEHAGIWYVIARDVRDEGSDLLGCWIFIPQNGVCWEVHTALLPCAWGERGQLAARLLPIWIWAASCCKRIITNVPTSNRLALHFAYKAGMEVFGVNRASYMKNGILYDQVMLGISKPYKPVIAEAEHALESRAEAEKEETCQ